MNNIKNKTTNCSECNDTGFLYYGNETDFDTEVCECAPLNSVIIKEITLENIHPDEANQIVCVFCSDYASDFFCGNCKEYKGLMTLGEWLAYTNESWIA